MGWRRRRGHDLLLPDRRHARQFERAGFHVEIFVNFSQAAGSATTCNEGTRKAFVFGEREPALCCD